VTQLYSRAQTSRSPYCYALGTGWPSYTLGHRLPGPRIVMPQEQGGPVIPPGTDFQVPVLLCSRNRVTQIYPRALGSLSVVSYDLQGYGGGILSRLHTGMFV
jgi:hypothetical protein